jgi:PKD repeat protein
LGVKGVKLTAATAIVAVLLFATNVPVSNAHQHVQEQQQQQQQLGLLQLLLEQLLTSQPATIENKTTTTTTTFQSTNDSFRVQVPQDWIVQDMSNTGVELGMEILQGYGLLGQLCPAAQQQQSPLVNVSSDTANVSNTTNSNNNSCQSAQEVIHVIRYPNLDARLELASDDDNNNGDIPTSNSSTIALDTVLGFQMLKLQEAGYYDIKIVNSVDTTINVISSLLNNRVMATIPAKLVEMTYNTNFAPNELRTGYFLSTATDLTPRNLGMTTGYGIFYERNSTTNAAEIMTASTTLPPPAPVIQIFDSFELLAGAEVEQALSAVLFGLLTQVAGNEGVGPAADILNVKIDSSNTEEYVAPSAYEFEADIGGGTEPYNISWDLNDDGIADSNEQTLVATFNEAGTYDIVLTVADIQGQIASDSVEIEVKEGGGGENEGVSTQDEEVLATLDEENDNEKSQIEETTQEQNPCNSLYPIACTSSSSTSTPQSNLACNDASTRNFESLSLDPYRLDGNDDHVSSDSADSDDTGCETKNNQAAGSDGLDSNINGSDNLLGLYDSGSPE